MFYLAFQKVIIFNFKLWILCLPSLHHPPDIPFNTPICGKFVRACFVEFEILTSLMTLDVQLSLGAYIQVCCTEQRIERGRSYSECVCM